MMMRMFTDLYDLEDAYFAGSVDLKTYLKEFCRLTGGKDGQHNHSDGCIQPGSTVWDDSGNSPDQRR